MFIRPQPYTCLGIEWTGYMYETCETVIPRKQLWRPKSSQVLRAFVTPGAVGPSFGGGIVCKRAAADMKVTEAKPKRSVKGV